MYDFRILILFLQKLDNQNLDYALLPKFQETFRADPKLRPQGSNFGSARVVGFVSFLPRENSILTFIVYLKLS